MLPIIISMLAGIAFGLAFCRGRVAFVGRAVTILIWLLLFMLGLGIGASDKVFDSIASIGFSALAVGVAAAIGSAAAAWLLWRCLGDEVR